MPPETYLLLERVSIVPPMSDSTDPLKVLHDRLMAEMPAGASHDGCPICQPESAEHTTSGEGMPETFSQEDVDAAVVASTAALQQRLADLEAQVQETEVGKAVADAVAAEATKLTELQNQLDTATAARTAAENRLAETEQFWSDAIAQNEQEVAFAARRTERIAKATESGVFAEDYIASNADRFAAMSDEDFEARLAEWALIAAKTPSAGGPNRSALTAAAQGSQVPASALSYITEFAAKRVDPRTLGGAH